MNPLRYLLPLLVLLRVSAQETPHVDTELVTLSLHEPVRDLYLWNGEKVVEFRSVSGGIGIPIPYKGPARLVLHSSEEPFLEEDPATPPAAVVELPANANRILLLTAKQEGSPFRIRAIPISFDDLKGGDYRFLNFSNQKAVVILEGESLVLAPGGMETFSNSNWETGSRDINIQLGSQTGEGLKVYSSVWGHRSNFRYFVFLFNGLTPVDPLIIRRVHDRAP